MDYAAKLRRMADYLDEHPTIAEKVAGKWSYPTEYVYATDWDDFQSTIVDLGGFDKSGYNGSLSATHREENDNDGTIFLVNVSVSGVCEARPKLDEDGEPVLRRKRTYIETDEMEQVMEYDCPQVWTS